MDKDGLLYVTARADDVINVAGHRLSTLAIENIILSHPDIAMACVISVPDEIKSEVPLCLFVIKEGKLDYCNPILPILIFCSSIRYSILRTASQPLIQIKITFLCLSLPAAFLIKIATEMCHNNNGRFEISSVFQN